MIYNPTYLRNEKFYGSRALDYVYLTYCLLRNEPSSINKVIKLQDPTANAKVWWSIVKEIYGERTQSTVATLIEGSRHVSDAREKAEILNQCFCSQSRVNVPLIPF